MLFVQGAVFLKIVYKTIKKFNIVKQSYYTLNYS